MKRTDSIAREFLSSAAIVLFATLAALTICPSAARAQSGAAYKLSWGDFAVAGGASNSATLALTGAGGLLNAGAMNSATYRMSGVIWSGGTLCIVEFDDFSRFAEQWLEPGKLLSGDLDDDGDVDFSDLTQLSDLWLERCPAGWLLGR